ncbi:MAG: hypothetical protein PW792_11245 [Acidobacteriaceae bacterium]|nr:hypothetical protein [Acidobacteriaceae bacterium]
MLNHQTISQKSTRALKMLFVLLVVLAAGRARASISVLLEQPYGNLRFVIPSGHSAIYFDHICADGPLKLRACRPGEMGAVISRYDGIEDYDWVVTPVVGYLYSVDSVGEIPDWVDRDMEAGLRDAYRREHLESIAPDLPDGSAPKGNWYETVGSAYDRTIYGFRMNSSKEQDAEIIALFNDRPNKSRYNGAFTNCADFSRVMINRLYPKAVRRNFVSDLGMTSPKAVARAVVHYAKKHPEMGLTTFVVPQVPGSIPRSGEVKGLAESLVKVYGIPLTLLSPTTAIITAAAYVFGGRFHLPKNSPVLVLRDEPVAPARRIETELADSKAVPVELSKRKELTPPATPTPMLLDGNVPASEMAPGSPTVSVFPDDFRLKY